MWLRKTQRKRGGKKSLPCTSVFLMTTRAIEMNCTFVNTVSICYILIDPTLLK